MYYYTRCYKRPELRYRHATYHQPVEPTESRPQFTSDQLLTVRQPTRSAVRYFGHVRPADLPSFRSNQGRLFDLKVQSGRGDILINYVVSLPPRPVSTVVVYLAR